MHPADYVFYVVAQWIFLFTMRRRGKKDGYWSYDQARESEPDQAKKVGSMRGHVGYWGSYLFALVVAYVLDVYSNQWNALEVVFVGTACAIYVCLGPLSSWAAATGNLSEPFARNHLTSIPGVMLGVFITFGASVVLLYLLFTHSEDKVEVWGTTGLVMVIAAIGILLPHWQTYKKLRRYDVNLTLWIWAGLLAAALYRLYG